LKHERIWSIAIENKDNISKADAKRPMAHLANKAIRLSCAMACEFTKNILLASVLLNVFNNLNALSANATNAGLVQDVREF
jgi:hypothetical protein